MKDVRAIVIRSWQSWRYFEYLLEWKASMLLKIKTGKYDSNCHWSIDGMGRRRHDKRPRSESHSTAAGCPKMLLPKRSSSESRLVSSSCVASRNLSPGSSDSDFTWYMQRMDSEVEQLCANREKKVFSTVCVHVVALDSSEQDPGKPTHQLHQPPQMGFVPDPETTGCTFRATVPPFRPPA